MTRHKAPKKRPWRQIFLDELAAATGSAGGLVTNADLRKRLNWDEPRYKRIKGQLRDEAAIVVGTGHGGKVGLAKAPGAQGLQVFISYSHADEALAKELIKHLEPLKKTGLIQTWHDRQIKAGDNIDATITAELEKAELILLLVSIDYINSKYCYDIELDRAIERHDAEEAVVVPVILRACLWHQAPFGRLSALPTDGKPVKSWPDIDAALVNVAEGLRDHAKARLEAHARA